MFWGKGTAWTNPGSEGSPEPVRVCKEAGVSGMCGVRVEWEKLVGTRPAGGPYWVKYRGPVSSS